MKLLGQRARKRRNDLDLHLNTVSAAVGINRAIFWSWEECLPSELSQEQIERWEAAMDVPSGWLLNQNIVLPEPVQVIKPQIEIDPGHSSSAAEEIFKISCRIQNPTANVDDLTETNLRNAKIFCKRYGVYGEENSAYQAIATFDVPHRQVRLICNKIRRDARMAKIKSPFIDNLLESVINVMPMSENDVDQRFKSELGESLSIKNLMWFAYDVLGKEMPAMFLNSIGEHSNSAAEEIRKISIWIANHSGKRPSTESEFRSAEIFIKRYGVDGGKTSYGAIGKLFGLTHERIRQIIEAMKSNAFNVKFDTPYIDNLLININEKMPLSDAEIDHLFRNELGESLTFKNLKRFTNEILNK